MSKTEAPAKKGTIKSEAIIGQGAKVAEQAARNLQSAIEKFAELPKQIEQYSLQIAAKEDQLAQLDVEMAERKRQNKLAIEMDFKENQAFFVKNYLATNGLISVEEKDYENLVAQLQVAEANNEDVVKKAVAVATNSLKSQYESENKVRQAEFGQKEASNIAKIASLEEKVKFLESQVTSWQQQLSDERKASVDRTKTQPVVNVQGATR